MGSSSLDRTGTDLVSLPCRKAGLKGLGLDSSMDEFIPLPGSSHFDPAVPDRQAWPAAARVPLTSATSGFRGNHSEKTTISPSGEIA